jgi:hypothetical protein
VIEPLLTVKIEGRKCTFVVDAGAMVSLIKPTKSTTEKESSAG